jgi:peptidoglycan hydrolase-like protein with peptidoglycan-binding domain
MDTKHIFWSLAVISVSVSMLWRPVLAKDDAMESVLGGVLGAVLVEGIKELNKQPDPSPSPENIHWNDTSPAPSQQHVLSKSSIAKENRRVRETQAALLKIGFYSGLVDGIAGEETIGAIKAWQTEFDQEADGKLTEAQFDLLKKVSDGGFSSMADYEAAQSAGFSTKKEYQSFAQSGFATKIDFIKAKEAGFSSKQEYDESIQKPNPVTVTTKEISSESMTPVAQTDAPIQSADNKAEGWWQKLKNNLENMNAPPLCDSQESVDNIRDLYLNSNMSGNAPYDLEDVTEVTYNEKLHVRQCEGVALGNNGRNMIQYTYSKAEDSLWSGYIIQAKMDPLTIEERERLNNAQSIGNLLLLNSMMNMQ